MPPASLKRCSVQAGPRLTLPWPQLVLLQQSCAWIRPLWVTFIIVHMCRRVWTKFFFRTLSWQSLASNECSCCGCSFKTHAEILFLLLLTNDRWQSFFLLLTFVSDPAGGLSQIPFPLRCCSPCCLEGAFGTINRLFMTVLLFWSTWVWLTKHLWLSGKEKQAENRLTVLGSSSQAWQTLMAGYTETMVASVP